MYANFFGLRCLPFEDRADTQFFHASSECEEALAAMEYEARFGNGMALIVGDAGTGKTLLLRTLVTRLHASDHVMVLTAPANGDTNLLRETCKGFGVTVPTSPSQARCLARLRRHFVRIAAAQHRAILLLDQAENLSVRSLTELVALTDLQGNDGSLLAVILAGQPRFRAMLDRPEFVRLRQRLFGERTLPALTASETREFIRHRLSVAGMADTDLFDRSALDLVYEASGGVPRLIHQVCHAAMLAAYGAGEKRVSRATTAEVTRKAFGGSRSANVHDMGVRHAVELTTGHVGTTSPRSIRETSMPGTAHSAPITAPGGNLESGASRGGFDAAQLAQSPCVRTTAIGGAAREGDYGNMNDRTTDVAAARLEQAVAQASQLCVRLEAGLAQQLATEQRLAQATTQGERIADVLVNGIRRATDQGESVESKLNDIVRKAHGEVRHIKTEAARASETACEAAQQADGIERACARADRVEARLSAFAEQLADRANHVQDTMSQLMAGAEAGEEVRTKLDRRLETFERGLSDATQAAELKLQRIVDHALSLAERGTAQINVVDSRLREAQDEADELSRRVVDAAMDECRARLQEQLDKHDRPPDDVEAMVKTLRASLQNATDEAGRVQAEITTAALVDYRQTLREEFQGHRRCCDEHIDTVQKRMREMEEETSTVAAEGRNAIEAVERDMRASIEEASRQATTHARKVETMLEGARRVADSALAEFQRAHARAVAQTNECEKRIASVDQRRLEQASDVAATIESVDRAARRTEEMAETIKTLQPSVDSLGDRVEVLESKRGALEAHTSETEVKLRHLATRISEGADAVESFAARADKVTSHLSSTLERGETLTAEARACCGKAETLQRNLASNLVDIGGACERLHILREHVDRGERLAETLSEARSKGEQIDKALAARVPEATTAADTLRTVTTEAQTRINQIGSHTAAGTELLERLADANVDGHKLFNGAGESMRGIETAVQQAGDKIGRLIEDVWSLNAKTEGGARQLSALNAAAAKLVGTLQAVTTPAQNVANGLADHLETAKHHIMNLAEHCGQADKLAPRLKSITAVLSNAKQLSADIRETLDEAQMAQECLSEGTAEAEEHAARLQEINTAAQSLLDIQGRLTREADQAAKRLTHQLDGTAREADQATKRLTHQLDATGGSVESAQRVLQAFTAQIEGVHGQLHDLEEKTQLIGRAIVAATAKPAEIAADAQAQALHLERVYVAVRKVFAGLSQAAAEAKKEAEIFDERSERAGRRLTQLTEETERASGTLHEWVEEAVRVQARLERTLRNAPSISQTHPGASLQEISVATTPAARMIKTGTKPRSDRVEAIRRPKATTSQEAEESPPRDRAAEIEKLIAEAKRTSAAART